MGLLQFAGGSAPQTIFQPQGGWGGVSSSPSNAPPMMFPGSYGGGGFFGSSPMMPASSTIGGTPTPQASASNPWQGAAPFVSPTMMGGGATDPFALGSGGFNIQAILQLLQRMGMGSGSPAPGGQMSPTPSSQPMQASAPSWMNSIAQMVAPQQGGYHPSVTPYYGGGG